MSAPTFETARLRLRPFADGDRAWSAAQESDARVMAHLRGPQSPEQSRARAERVIAGFTKHGFGFWVVERRAEGDRIGIAGLKLVDTEGAPMQGALEVGWRFGAEHWGRGYAREAAAAVLDHAFGPLGVPHILAFTGIGNAPSWRLMERLGMTRRTDLDFDDPRYPGDPSIAYLIEAERWRA